MSTVDAASMADQFAYYDIYSAESRYNTKLSAVTAKRSAFSSLQTSLSSLKTSLYDFTKYNGTVNKSAATVSSEDYLSVSASDTAANADLDIFVSQLATAQQYAFDLGEIDDPKTAISPQTGSMSITRKNADGVEEEIYNINIANLTGTGEGGEVTYQDVVNEINSVAGDDVTANLISTNGELKLLVSSNETGTDNGFSISFEEEELDVDGNPVLGADGNPEMVTHTAFGEASELKVAQNAIIYLGGKDGLKLENSSNTFTDLVDGVDVTLIKAQDPESTETTNVTVGADVDSSIEALQEFITKFNETIAKINDLTATSSSEDGERGVLASDGTARGVKSTLLNTLRGEFNGNYLFELGIEISRDGTLSLDTDAFEEAFTNSELDIDAMLTGENGAFKVLESTIDTYTKTGVGLLSTRIDTLDQEKSNINDRLDALDLKYEKAYNRYLKQFTAMNNAIMSMESAMSSFTYY